jgi:hypothetical protein
VTPGSGRCAVGPVACTRARSLVGDGHAPGIRRSGRRPGPPRTPAPARTLAGPARQPHATDRRLTADPAPAQDGSASSERSRGASDEETQGATSSPPWPASARRGGNAASTGVAEPAPGRPPSLRWPQPPGSSEAACSPLGATSRRPRQTSPRLTLRPSLVGGKLSAVAVPPGRPSGLREVRRDVNEHALDLRPRLSARSSGERRGVELDEPRSSCSCGSDDARTHF